MLVLTRKLGQAIRVGDDVRVVVMELRGKQVRLGIEAPDHVQLYQDEATEKRRERYRIAADERAPLRDSVWHRIAATVGGLGGR